MQLAPEQMKYQKGLIAYSRILLALSSIGTALILGWLLKFSSYGFDFTDESFYLVSISNPFLYDWSVTQFGFIYHPLYSLLDGDIANLRRANIVITFGLSWILASALLKELTPDDSTHKPTLFAAAAGVAISSLIIFDSWLPTPSYNSLALQAILVSSIGLVLADKYSSWKSISGWMLIGLGGWLAFMAKPSTALALAIGAFLYLILARKASLRLLLLSIGTALILLVLSALLIDGSVHAFLDRLETGVEFASYLGSGHTLEKIIRFDDFQLSSREELSMKVFAGLAFVAMWCAYSERIFEKTVAMIFSLFCLVVVISLSAGLIHKTAEFGQFQGLMIWSVAFPAMAFGLTSFRQKARHFIRPAHWAIALLFLAMPYIYAFGTNNNYWQTEGAAAIFWLLAGVVLLAPLARVKNSWNFVLPLALATQLITATLLQTGLEQPYRQARPLRLNDKAIEIGASGSDLILSKEDADYVEAAKNSARIAGLQPGTSIIDLTGQSPGILYALRAKNIGQAWMIGGYPGSVLLTPAALTRNSCEELSRAWLLVEPNGPRSIPDGVLSIFGANLRQHYTEAASWQTSNGAGGYPFRRLQVLYKPAKQGDVLKTCHRWRAGGAG